MRKYPVLQGGSEVLSLPDAFGKIGRYRGEPVNFRVDMGTLLQAFETLVFLCFECAAFESAAVGIAVEQQPQISDERRIQLFDRWDQRGQAVSGDRVVEFRLFPQAVHACEQTAEQCLCIFCRKRGPVKVDIFMTVIRTEPDQVFFGSGDEDQFKLFVEPRQCSEFVLFIRLLLDTADSMTVCLKVSGGYLYDTAVKNIYRLGCLRSR